MFNIPCRWWSGLQKQPTMNIESIPLTSASQANKSIRTNRFPTLTEWRRWIIETLEEVMDAMKRGSTSLKKTSKFWHIPLTFLLNYLNHKTRSNKLGPQGLLTNEEGKNSWVEFLGRMGTFNYLVVVQNESGIKDSY